MVFHDRNLTCSECGSSFVFSAEDQQYHSEKGYTNEPKRCPNCRQARRAQQGGSGGGFGGGSGGGYGRSSAPREMHAATCAQCGKATEVPFQPRGDRPVYCNDCFRQQRGSSSSSSRRSY